MSRSSPPAASWLLAVSVTMAVAPKAARAAEPVLPAVTLACEQRASKGRVVCDVDIEVLEGRLVWADAVVIEAPSFARPLRSRVGFLEAAVRSERRVRLPIAVVAAHDGEGRLLVRARSVVCDFEGGEELCLPHTVEVEAKVRVGPLGPG